MYTIYALSSGMLPSGVAVIRLSGGESLTILKNMIGYIPKARYMSLTKIKDKNNNIIDNGLVVYFPKPNSFTGEDCVEFHLHGGKAVVNKFLQELSTFTNVRLAEAGEFSKRAFLNGKIDLTQAEGLADLIAAETESQRRLALLESDGLLSKQYENWRLKIIKMRSLLEAQFDFSEEEEISSELLEITYNEMKKLSSEITNYINISERSYSVKDGLKIVLIGAPNSGKSSLINNLSGREISIVSNEAGTTRDSIEVRLSLAGMIVNIVDTAGIRETKSDSIEYKGIEKAKNHLNTADLVILLEDMQNPIKIDLSFYQGDIWYIGNKCDIIETNNNKYDLKISSLLGINIDILLDRISKYCYTKQLEIGDIIPARLRQRLILSDILNLIDEILINIEQPLEIQAEILRQISHLFGRLTGTVDVEDMLDFIFSEFCIGK
ncbi:tRNA uridine-5-carboxymethylaminomethyl(34) synthesis GTPase MnmE [Bartonella sp. DGB1]|uniref:tRNA uridine-5-carboxymethylaminomethyl(34) synthesis GTPase MnmE n=1 Tax=Bartonella sp. DGB1 TaxID=3239807 RepID=UPI003526A7AD